MSREQTLGKTAFLNKTPVGLILTVNAPLKRALHIAVTGKVEAREICAALEATPMNFDATPPTGGRMDNS